MIKRALVSVTDKTGVVEFCTELNKLGYEVRTRCKSYTDR